MVSSFKHVIICNEHSEINVVVLYVQLNPNLGAGMAFT